MMEGMILTVFEDFYGILVDHFPLGFLATFQGKLKLSVPLSVATRGS